MKKNLLILLIWAITAPMVLAASHPLLPPFGINKSFEQIQFESEAGQKHFQPILEAEAPKHLDLLKIMTPVKDQGYRGTCVAFSIAALMESQIKRITGRTVDLSEQYLYWESKFIGPILPTSDDSLALRLLRAIDSSVSHAGGENYRGVPLEEIWPYEAYSWYEKRQAHPECYKAAKIDDEKIPKICLTNGSPSPAALQSRKFFVTESQNIPSSPEAITGFLRIGIPVIVSLDFYTLAWGFNNYRGLRYLTGSVSMPEKGDSNEGGHAVLIAGYDMETKSYLFKNSWGTDDWAKDSKLPGFGTIPFDYIRKHAVATVAKVPLEP